MSYVPSAAAQVLVTVIPLAGIVMGSAVLFFYLLWSFRAKRMLIEKGLYKRPEFDIDTFSLFLGLVLTAIGFSLLFFFLVKSGMSYGLLSGMIPFSTGVSLLIFFAIRARAWKKNG